jgi:hypothetical protein
MAVICVVTVTRTDLGKSREKNNVLGFPGPTEALKLLVLSRSLAIAEGFKMRNIIIDRTVACFAFNRTNMNAFGLCSPRLWRCSQTICTSAPIRDTTLSSSPKAAEETQDVTTLDSLLKIVSKWPQTDLLIFARRKYVLIDN